jgi:LmbE family N-acetylglucosaminyl deacetylase
VLSRNALLLLAVLTLVPSTAGVATAVAPNARPVEIMDGAEIAIALKRLRTVGTVLYVAAHPDDENTGLLSYFVSGRGLRTGYLSMTRGDGGQNLIGIETGEALGVIRTHELLAARRVDHAEQFFTRALDFGFSKNPEETFAFWGHDEILSDVVRVIRTFRPDVIVTRFPPDSTAGHGHHTASAILAEEAFRAAADAKSIPALKSLAPWTPRRIAWNVFRADPSKRDASQPKLFTIDIGEYQPLLGRSYAEIAGESRSMHKSQGFGAPERRGSIPNYFEIRAGAPSTTDLFEGIQLDWTRVRNGAELDKLLAKIEREYDPRRPAAILPQLIQAHEAMRRLEASPWTEPKRAELLEIIRSCAGLWLEASATAPSAIPGAPVTVTVSALNRSDFVLTLDTVTLPYDAAVMDTALQQPLSGRVLATNRTASGMATVTLPADAAFTSPYWLNERATKGRFVVKDPALIGRAENPPALTAKFTLRAGNERLVYEIPVVYRWVDPVQGERYRSFDVEPPVTMHFDQTAYLFPDTASRDVRVSVTAGSAAASGKLRLAAPAGFRVRPESVDFDLAAGAERAVSFRVVPPAGAARGAVSAVASVGGKDYSKGRLAVDYPHISPRVLLPPAEAQLLRTDLKRTGETIGYIMGSGDAGPEALRQMGYAVTLLTDEDLETTNLFAYDAIVTGVRAYNTRPRLLALRTRLLDYVEAGGTLVVQYNTLDPKLQNKLGPNPLSISRDRVTVEEAEMRFRKADSPLLNAPNKITTADFEGWVQERGLYFANPWDGAYEAPLECNDPRETPKGGSLLVARHGKGIFIYTGLSFFRQLPAGVPGAYRLFANLVSARQ